MIPAWDVITSDPRWQTLDESEKLRIFHEYLRDIGNLPSWKDLTQKEKFNIIRAMEKDAGFYKEKPVYTPSPGTLTNIARGARESVGTTLQSIGKGLDVVGNTFKSIVKGDNVSEDKDSGQSSVTKLGKSIMPEPMPESAGIRERLERGIGQAVADIATLYVPAGYITRGVKGIGAVQKLGSVIEKIFSSKVSPAVVSKLAQLPGETLHQIATFALAGGIKEGPKGAIEGAGIAIPFSIANLPASRLIRALSAGAIGAGISAIEGVSEQDYIVNTLLMTGLGALSPGIKAKLIKEAIKTPDKPISALPSAKELLNKSLIEKPTKPATTESTLTAGGDKPPKGSKPVEVSQVFSEGEKAVKLQETQAQAEQNQITETVKDIATPSETTPKVEKPIPPEGVLSIEEAQRRFSSGDALLKEMLHEKPLINLETMKRVTNAAAELFINHGVKRNKEILLIDQVNSMLTSGMIKLPEYESILKKNGLTMFEFGNALVRLSPRYAGQILNSLSQLERQINTALGEKAGSEFLGGIEAGVMESIPSLWKRLDNVRRGLMVTQLKTAVRNAQTQLGTLTLDGFVELLDRSLQKTLTNKDVPPISESFGKLTAVFQKNKALTDAILKNYPSQYNRMFGIYAGELSKAAKEAKKEGWLPTRAADRVLTGLEKSTQILNTLNTFQEYVIRRAAFVAELEQRLNRVGKSLYDKKGFTKVNDYINEIDFKDLKGSVDHALELTFAKMPERETLSRKFIELINHPKLAFIATLPFPYPRFLVNSIKYISDHSPAGFMKIALSPKEWTAIRQGHYRQLSKAMVGTAIFLTAYQIRNSEYAGEKWYELNIDGKTYDLRPFNPFAAHFFVADVLKRYKDGTLTQLTTKDIAMGILSSNLRAGTGLYILDEFLKLLTPSGDPEKALYKLKRLAGETIAGFTVPFRQLKDFVSAFDETQAVVREKSLSPLIAPAISNIPGLANILPEYRSPLKGETTKTENPVFSQVTGWQSRTKTPFEKEIDKAGISFQEIFTPTGIPEIDYRIKERMGKLSDKIGGIVEQSEYKEMTNEEKKYFLNKLLDNIYNTAKKEVLIDLVVQGRTDLLDKYINQSISAKEKRANPFYKRLIERR